MATGEEKTVSPDLVKLAIVGVVGAHGVGHALGWMPAWGVATFQGVSSRSWLLSGLIGDGGSRALGGALWLAPMVGFVLAAAGLFAGQSWWRPVAGCSAVVSMLAILLFWEALPPGSRVGAIAVNVAIGVGLVLTAGAAASAA
jgi:hypothetical protein